MWLPLLFFVFIFGCLLLVVRKWALRKTDRRIIHREFPDPILGLSAQESIPLVKNPPQTVQESSVYMQGSLEIIIFYIMAPSGYPYNGYELLQSLLSNGLRYGERNIFHRYETKTGGGRILFSLASVNKPGTFELSKMGGFSCPGLVMFMLLNQVSDAVSAFEAMLEAAAQLSEDLGGEIWGMDRQILTMDVLSDLRKQVRLFEESRRIPDLFETDLLK